VVHWRGVFAEVKAKQKGFVLFGTEHHLSILIKMQPSESEKFADLVLSISTAIYEKNKTFYNSLAKGDELDFKATVISMGNEFKMHHLHGVDTSKTGTHIEIGDVKIRETETGADDDHHH
jgi:hypothetical protein